MSIRVVCAACGLTKEQLRAHWRRVNGGSNPGECTKLWRAVGHSSSSWHPEAKPVKGCMSNEEFGLTGDPYYSYTAQYDHGRRSAGYEVPFFSSSVAKEWRE